MKKLLFIVTLFIMISCSNSQKQNDGNQTTICERTDTTVMSETTNAVQKDQDVISRIKHIYSVIFNHKENYALEKSFYSKEFHAIKKEGDILFKELWGPDCYFWTLTQDWSDNSVLKEASIAKVKNDTAVIVKCVMDITVGNDMEDEKYHNHTLYITMIKEDGVWVGDDCTDGIFSYKQCSLDNIRQQKEEIMKDEK